MIDPCTRHAPHGSLTCPQCIERHCDAIKARQRNLSPVEIAAGIVDDVIEDTHFGECYECGTTISGTSRLPPKAKCSECHDLDRCSVCDYEAGRSAADYRIHIEHGGRP